MDNQNQTSEDQKAKGLFTGAAATAEAVASEAVVAATAVAETEETAKAPDERELLMQRARMMGINFSNNIGTDTLRQRINAKMDGAAVKEADPELDAGESTAPAVEINALSGEPANAPVKSARQQLMDEQLKMVRVRITCMDPKKKDLQGEVFTVANEYIGTVRKFIPFGEVTDDGYHIPFCLYTMLDERRFLNIRTVKDARTGRERVESNYAREFALEVLPQLTEADLARLATAQAAAGSIDGSHQ